MINKKLRQKTLRRAQILRLFNKSYLVYSVLAILGFVSALVIHSCIFPVIFLCSIVLAIISACVHVIFLEHIEDNKPLTKKERKRTVFVLDVVNEKSYFEIRYLKPGTKVRAVNYGYTLSYE